MTNATYESLLLSTLKKIDSAREMIMVDKPWQAETILREAQRSIRVSIFGDVDPPKRERLVSRGFSRGR